MQMCAVNMDTYFADVSMNLGEPTPAGHRSVSSEYGRPVGSGSHISAPGGV